MQRINFLNKNSYKQHAQLRIWFSIAIASTSLLMIILGAFYLLNYNNYTYMISQKKSLQEITPITEQLIATKQKQLKEHEELSDIFLPISEKNNMANPALLLQHLKEHSKKNNFQSLCIKKNCLEIKILTSSLKDLKNLTTYMAKLPAYKDLFVAQLEQNNEKFSVLLKTEETILKNYK